MILIIGFLTGLRTAVTSVWWLVAHIRTQCGFLTSKIMCIMKT